MQVRPSLRRSALSLRTEQMVSVCCSVAVLVSLVACGSTRTPTAPTVGGAGSAPERRIVVLGDSLAVSPSRERAFPARLQERLDASYPGWVVINAGVGGDTTTGGIRRIDEVLSSDPAILILELGANDGLSGTPIETIEVNLSRLIERARARGTAVLLCGMETPPVNGWSYSLEYHRLFPRLAERYQVPLVPFLLEGVALNPDLNEADGFHPNAAGAGRVADTVWRHLEPLVASLDRSRLNVR